MGLVGESGCGKSTLGRGVLGLLPDAAKMKGRVLFEGEDLGTLPKRELRALRGPALRLIFQAPKARPHPLIRMSRHFLVVVKTHEPGLTKTGLRRRGGGTLRAM